MFLGDLELNADSPNQESVQYGNIDQHCWRSVLSEYSCFDIRYFRWFTSEYVIYFLIVVKFADAPSVVTMLLVLQLLVVEDGVKTHSWPLPLLNS